MNGPTSSPEQTPPEWSPIADADERRKAQNRVAQRKYRLRQKAKIDRAHTTLLPILSAQHAVPASTPGTPWYGWNGPACHPHGSTPTPPSDPIQGRAFNTYNCDTDPSETTVNTWHGNNALQATVDAAGTGVHVLPMVDGCTEDRTGAGCLASHKHTSAAEQDLNTWLAGEGQRDGSADQPMACFQSSALAEAGIDSGEGIGDEFDRFGTIIDVNECAQDYISAGDQERLRDIVDPGFCSPDSLLSTAIPAAQQGRLSWPSIECLTTDPVSGFDHLPFDLPSVWDLDDSHHIGRFDHPESAQCLPSASPQMVSQQMSPGPPAALHTWSSTARPGSSGSPCIGNRRTSEYERTFGSPLITAITHGHLETARLLIRSGAKLDIPLEGGMTALHVAVQKGEPAIVSSLLELGADVLTRDADGRGLLHTAVERSRTDLVRILLRWCASGRADNALSATPSSRPRRSALQRFLDAQDSQGRTAVHWCAVLGATNILKILLEYNADVNLGIR